MSTNSNDFSKHNENSKLNDKDVFDWDSALEWMEGDEELLKELIEIFLSVYPEQMSMIKEAIDRCDSASLQESAHKMSGSISCFGAKNVHNAVVKLEQMGKENKLDGVNESYRDLVEQIKRLTSIFRHIECE